MNSVSSCFTILNDFGMHARPASLFVHAARRYEADIRVQKGNKIVDGKSILDLLTIGAGKGSLLTVTADGRDAPSAMGEIESLFASSFGET